MSPKVNSASFGATTADEDDDYDYDHNDLVIEGNIGEIPYRLYPIDVEPSDLWTRPPRQLDTQTFNPAQLLSQLSSSSSTENNNNEPECDPRLKYYANKANATNVATFQQMLIQQQQQQTPASPSSVATTATTTTNTATTSPSSSTPVAAPSASPAPPSTSSEPSKASTKTASRADPRLVSRAANTSNNLSPTRSISPPTLESKNDLISIQNRQVSSSSLLSSLPDFQFPKVAPSPSTANISTTLTSNLLQSQMQEQSTVKLSIADYKRKLQKPITSASSVNAANTNASSSVGASAINPGTAATLPPTSTSQLIMNSLFSGLNSTSSQSSSSSSLPSIPSYTVNLQAPQSLHELFRNFQS